MKVGVITFPGSNSDTDLLYVWKHIFGISVVSLWHKETDLQGCDLVCLPGGFAHGDYLRTGAIARFSPIMKEVVRHAEKGGYVWGICNGFQVLCEAGLLPGVLLRNRDIKFVCKNVYLLPQKGGFTSHMAQKTYEIPVAHGEGNYHCNDEQLKELSDKGEILFKYCDFSGNLTEESNPNGSPENIAGICRKNIWGMMPHPERAADPYVGNENGKAFFEAVIKVIG